MGWSPVSVLTPSTSVQEWKKREVLSQASLWACLVCLRAAPLEQSRKRKQSATTEVGVPILCWRNDLHELQIASTTTSDRGV